MALEGMAIDGAKSLLHMVASRGLDEFKLLWGFKDDLRTFQKEYKMILASLSRVDNNTPDMPQPVREWLTEIKDLAHDAQDMMDELAYENIRLKLELTHKIKNKFCKFFTSSNPIFFRAKMAHRVSNLRASIANIYQLAANLDAPINITEPYETRVSRNMKISSKVLKQARDMADVSIMVGREAEKSMLVEQLCRPIDTTRESPYVLAIVGLPGLGKTTLARQVCNDEAVVNVFANKFWVTVSKDFDIERIFKEMLMSITGTSANVPPNADAIIKKLEEQMRGKNYLLVLDDVWNIYGELWDNFLVTLRKIGKGMILVTTRDHGVAGVAHTVHNLTELNDADSWCLFEKIAFDGRSLKKIQMFQKAGRVIVRKCHGLPLAIKTIAGMLRSEDKLHQWRRIVNSELWNLPLGDAGILPSLKLSFYHLPSPSLKRCFAFLATYKKGMMMHRDDIIQMWSALGYLGEERGGSDIEEGTGETFLKALLNISFLLAHQRDDLGNITTYRMHDLVHDLVSHVSDECIHLEGIRNPRAQDASAVRQLHLHQQLEDMSELPETLMLQRLRFLKAGFRLPDDLLLHARYLRVLDLSWTGLEELPTAVGGLKCLRYLDLSGNQIKALPESITRLYNLQTLKLKKCNRLSQFPLGLGKLINLRHLTTSAYVKVPPGIAGLTSLQTAPLLELGPADAASFQIQELRRLPHISGVLAIRGLQHVKTSEEAEKAQISKKDRIETLELIGSEQRDERGTFSNCEVLKALQPHQYLRSLKVQGFHGEEFPDWLHKMAVFDAEINNEECFDSLVKLELIECERCENLPVLGQLQSLRILRLQKMGGVQKIGAGQFYGTFDDTDGEWILNNHYFADLKEFIIEDLPNLEEWMAPADSKAIAFADLEVLKIVGCPLLAKVPMFNFLRLRVLVVEKVFSGEPLIRLLQNCNLPSLTSLTMKFIGGLMYLPEELSLCTSLRELRISECGDLSYLVAGEDRDWLNKLTSLEVLEVGGCSNELIYFPDVSEMVSLRELIIHNCVGITCPPSGLESCKSLRQLRFCWCPNMEIPHNLLPRLHCVEYFGLAGLGKGLHLFEEMQQLEGLKMLGVGCFGEETEHFPGLEHLSEIQSLESLRLHGWNTLQSLPEELQNFKSLKVLAIINFNCLKEVPDWLCNLSSLEVLMFIECENLTTLPSPEALQRLQKLWYLEIKDCMLLKASCNKITGSEWHKIAHLRTIMIDDEAIQHFN